jgi:hypothetical protein
VVTAGLETAAARDAKGYLAPLFRLQGEILASGGGNEAYAERVGDALTLATQLGMQPEVAHCRFALGKLHRCSGKRHAADEHLRAAIAMYRKMNMRFWLQQAEGDGRANVIRVANAGRDGPRQSSSS